MRLVVGVLACLGAGAMTLALADPSSPAPPQPAAPSSSSASAPATPAASAASTTQTPAPAAKPALDPDEKRLLAQGYKPEMRKSEKVFCRTDEVIGSRLGGIKHCGTVAQLKADQAATREEIEKLQRDVAPPSK